MSGNIILVTMRHPGAKLFHDFNLTEGRHSKTVSIGPRLLPSLPKENKFISFYQRTLCCMYAKFNNDVYLILNIQGSQFN